MMNLDMEYNTQRPKMEIPEYGRSVQKMIDFACTVKDRDERNTVARAIIKVMGQLAPHLRDEEDQNHKLWNHLFIMSDFKLDIDSPHPKPTPESFYSKPEIVPYPKGKIRYGHYGKTIQLLIAKAIEKEDLREKEAMTLDIANLMKRMYLTFNRDTVTDELIYKQLKELSDGHLTIAEGTELTDTAQLLKQRPTQATQGTNNNNRKKRKGGIHRKKRF